MESFVSVSCFLPELQTIRTEVLTSLSLQERSEFFEMGSFPGINLDKARFELQSAIVIAHSVPSKVHEQKDG